MPEIRHFHFNNRSQRDKDHNELLSMERVPGFTRGTLFSMPRSCIYSTPTSPSPLNIPLQDDIILHGYGLC